MQNHLVHLLLLGGFAKLRNEQVFDYLSKGLGKVFDSLKKKGALTVDDINDAMREIRIALIGADVALPVIKHLIEQIKTKAVGTEVMSSITPGQMVVKIVNDELVNILTHDDNALNLRDAPPIVILMAGLQGAGKTTTAAKLALRLKQKHKKKVLMASTDTRRPAAQKQLEVLGKQISIDTLKIIDSETAVQISKRALKEAKSGHYDVLIIDTAGRLSVDDEMMAELKNMSDFLKPSETLFVADCMMGQDAVNVAQVFHENLKLTGIVMTKTEGDARGGAALSMKFVTNCPIKFLGVGEKLNELEEFHAAGIASRILGMGDVVALVEKMQDVVDEQESKKMLKKLQKGSFDMNDLLSQFKMMKKLGGVSSVVSMLPGFGKLKNSAEHLKYGEAMIKKQEAVIQSMTIAERRNPKIVDASRKRRIAAGAGVQVQEVNGLLKRYAEMSGMLKKFGNMDSKSLQKKFSSGFIN